MLFAVSEHLLYWRLLYSLETLIKSIRYIYFDLPVVVNLLWFFFNGFLFHSERLHFFRVVYFAKSSNIKITHVAYKDKFYSFRLCLISVTHYLLSIIIFATPAVTICDSFRVWFIFT